MKTETFFRWKRRNNGEHLVVWPLFAHGVWKISRAKGLPKEATWELSRADNDGDEYRVISHHATVDQAKQAADAWEPQKPEVNIRLDKKTVHVV